MSAFGLVQQAVRTALAAKIEGQDRKAASAQIGDNFIIFFNIFGAALDKTDRASDLLCRGRPARAAQLHAGTVQPLQCSAGRRGITCNRDKTGPGILRLQSRCRLCNFQNQCLTQ